MSDTIHVHAEQPYDVTVSRGCLASLAGLTAGRRASESPPRNPWRTFLLPNQQFPE